MENDWKVAGIDFKQKSARYSFRKKDLFGGGWRRQQPGICCHVKPRASLSKTKEKFFYRGEEEVGGERAEGLL